ncbi:N-6 DNA Methylase [Peptostreptococcus stomatis DSM 17678]|uniref:site-specific DNA-methyltransferase (adenine-specific) n=1 Tax=Peptostreptococcus stomatis DSM 17678 TaxID=596315 RepID=E0E427_9FIRM|nr:class I SAM-dependent DNA methyltransferase [Peptostreptococcus stomatis]EFM64402.1 N-6 DNA Methylase [Peptostreptococcus stomatis DSM 17678]
MSINISDKSNFIWKIADLLRGDYKQHEYADVILPFTVLKRLDSVLIDNHDEVVKLNKTLTYKNKDPFLCRASGYKFYNVSEFTFEKLKDDPNNLDENIVDYIKGFSENAREILEAFNIYTQIERLEKAGLLYLIVSKFADEIDLHPDRVSNTEMGYIFEELIRKFSEMSNETAGEHFTPREVIRLMVAVLFDPDMDKISSPSFMAKLYDPAAGTGGMLSAGISYAEELNERAIIEVYGQELNQSTYAICKSDTLIKGKGYENIYYGNSFTEDGVKNEKFDYMLCNPPFGVEWKKYQDAVKDEAQSLGFDGRFGAGLPRISDGSFLFLQHMISKMKDPKNGGSRIGIVFNGSPLFTGDAGSGESEIRRWIIENGWLETIIALPDQLFYNTGILTYVWILSNRKSKLRQGKIQLIDGTSFFERMRKPLGDKRKKLSEEDTKKIANIYGSFVDSEYSKIFDEDDFAHYKITVERPLRLNFMVSPDRIEKLKEETAFINLAKSRKKNEETRNKEIEEGEKLQRDIIHVLEMMDDSVFYKDRAKFEKILNKAFKAAGISIKAPLKKAILNALSEKDETAEICRDKKGNPEPDTELRDIEQIPFKDDIEEYFKREVLPYAPDAWIDEDKTKIGYEIPFTRYFYKYEELGDAKETLEEIKELGLSIQESISSLFEEE